MKSCIYFGDVSHHRLQPGRHGFRYSLFMMYLDLDELPDLFRPFLLWSAKFPALAWFRREDHLGDTNTQLKQSVIELIFEKTGKLHDGPVRLLTHLRYFGYCMNPVSFYYCWNGSGSRLDYIVAEVHNTPWGETHCYVMDCRAAEKEGDAYLFTFDKEFHVSPFMDMCQRYRWCLSAPGPDLNINMDSYEREQRVFNAHMQLRHKTINHFSMAVMLLSYPLMTAKVISAIYWQALRLWLKKTPFYSHPRHLEKEINS